MKKPAPTAEEKTPAPAPPEPTAPAAPTACGATHGDRSCTLASGHAGHHHSMPAERTIDALVSWR